MASLNRVFVIGNLGADPEVRFTPGGQAVANFSVATTEVWNDKTSGEKQERTEWHRIVVWGKQGELCGEHLRKGRQVHIEGKLQTRSWDDKTSGQKKYATEIVADRVTFLGGKGDGQSTSDRGSGGGYERRGDGGGRSTGRETQAEPPPLDDSEIPF